MKEKRAVLMKANLEGFTGVAHLYKVNPPHEGHNYVIVSATNISGPETYIFGANKDGQVLNWVELGGSFQGGLDHAEALRNAGYKIGEEK